MILQPGWLRKEINRAVERSQQFKKVVRMSVKWTVIDIFWSDNQQELFIGIQPETSFDDIKEAESFRSHYLDTHPHTNPQNVQVIQYSE